MKFSPEGRTGPCDALIIEIGEFSVITVCNGGQIHQLHRDVVNFSPIKLWSYEKKRPGSCTWLEDDPRMRRVTFFATFTAIVVHYSIVALMV